MTDLRALRRSAGTLAASFVLVGALLVACDESEKKEETPAATEQTAGDTKTAATTESSATTETAATSEAATAPAETTAPAESAAATETTAAAETAPAATETTAASETAPAETAPAAETTAAASGDAGALATNLTESGSTASTTGDTAAATAESASSESATTTTESTTTTEATAPASDTAAATTEQPASETAAAATTETPTEPAAETAAAEGPAATETTTETTPPATTEAAASSTTESSTESMAATEAAATAATTDAAASAETAAATTEPAAEATAASEPAAEQPAETTVAVADTASATVSETTETAAAAVEVATTATEAAGDTAADAVAAAAQVAETVQTADVPEITIAPGVPLMVLPKLSGEIRVLNWQGYGTDEAWAVKAFSERTGVKVVHDHFNSEQEMLTKLRTSPGTYDVVLINSSFTGQAIDEKLIQPVDTAKITNYQDLSPTLAGAKPFSRDGYTYGVAWVWGVTSFAYNTEVITTKPTSIEALWDPQYAGKIGWRDDAVEAVQMAAIATGQDINNPADLEKIKAKLKELKPQIKTYWSSEDEWNKAFSAKDYVISVYWSGSAARSKKAFNLPVEFVIPTEGAIGWLDGLSIATGAPNPDAAHAFIDYMVSPEFYVTWDNNVGAPASSNVKAMEMLPEDALNRTVLNDPAVQQRLWFMAPIPDDRRAQYTELWEEVKTFFTQ